MEEEVSKVGEQGRGEAVEMKREEIRPEERRVGSKEGVRREGRKQGSK